MNLNSESDFVKIGIEIGEHASDYENFIDHIKDNYDIKKVDFILIVMRQTEMLETTWEKWASFFKDTKTYFAFLYTQQRGAPKGKESHFTNGIVEKIVEVAGEYFIGDMIGETGGLCSWSEGYYEDIGIEKQKFTNMNEAQAYYVNHVEQTVNLDKKFKVPAVLAVEATTLSRYNFKAGVDYTFVEMMCGNPEVVFASARGASKAYGKKWWASHIANEWYGGYKNDDSLKYKRLKLAYYMSFLAGAKYIYPESGDLKIASYGSDYDSDSTFCKSYRNIWNEFSDFVHLHKRPQEGPLTKVGFLQGNLDSWTGWGGSTIWNRFGEEDWVYGDAESGWDILEDIYKGEKWHVPTVYGEKSNPYSVPFGQYDIVPAEATVEVLSKYSCLFFIGWNTMTEDIYFKLKEYVYNGGKLFMTAAHLNTSDVPGKQWVPVNGGDVSDLFGCKIKGPGRRLNQGVKFISESLIPEYKYPTVINGKCDPILSGGYLDCADIELTDGKVIAILADKFFGWRDNSPAILVEKAYGNGFASIVTTLDYPGSRGVEKLYKVLLRTSLSGEEEQSGLRVLGSSKLYYSVYEGGGKKFTVYLLNTDYNNSVDATLQTDKLNTKISISSCEICIAYIQDQHICTPQSTNIFVEGMKCNQDMLEISIKGIGKHEKITLTSVDKPKKVMTCEYELPFRTEGNNTIFNIDIEGVIDVKIVF